MLVHRSLKPFDTSKSSTFKSSSKRFIITYGSGSVRGAVGTDMVSIGSMKFKSVNLGVVTEEGTQFADFDMDAICGLGFGYSRFSRFFPHSTIH